ncbi:uncharacterized protein CANTADRAFT_132192 [Suhomyces tanzawaensis NRRL Y-17324]|uniref:Uncharacterized protein n=1 Tax=Suhomyces tanzawaensis NRRL Y-17324 TaxID=984487 RepID=A0A1E4SR83_9ASCO|nr:uncharacterized protein CANTADRAFT_132192 [Suhomyces tanzawaensis NRRL Y-17324]ODV82019.1 hypothetical protein CANTADRAFT_132192 [Suhomyces tanzawaensis NRRL Y-17324]
MVLWSSWLWHLLNTQNVPSSILGRIIFLAAKRHFFYTDRLCFSICECLKSSK